MDSQLTSPPRISRRTRYAAVAVAMGAVFVLRLVWPELGPVLLAPVMLGAWWFGRWAGVALGLVAMGLFVLARELDPVGPEAGAVRFASFCGIGFLVGYLAEERRGLRARVGVQDRELGELHRIQEALAPADVPPRPALDLGYAYAPAQEGVAGDFCLVAEGPRAETTVIAIGDVSGKGLDAARRAAFVRTALATSAPFTDDPARLLELGNAGLVEHAGTSATFVTALCLTHRPSDGTISWASAGHPPPVGLDDGRPLPNGHGRGAALGLEREITLLGHHAHLSPGNGLLLFTDGLTEARSVDDPGRLFGEERVAALLRRRRGASPPDLVAELQAAASDFAAGTLGDDLCLLALRARMN